MDRACFLALLLAPSLAAAADRVTVKGTVLVGTVKSVSSKQVVMSTVYGKGEIAIATADVEAIETDAPFHVFHDERDAETVGRVVGVTPDAVTLVAADGATREVPFAEVYAAPRDPGPDANWFERRPVELPYWSGSYDLAFSATQSTVNTTALATGLGLRRERGPSRLRFDASYLRSTTHDEEDDLGTPEDETDEQVTADELRGFLRQEYDLMARVFALGSLEAEHDGLESLAYRLIPKLGAGYKVVNTETVRFSVDAGPAYVYEKFFGGDTNSYVALAFGAESDWKLPVLGASWHSRLDYLPSLSNWMNDYRLRGETALLVPIYEQLSFKASLIDEYNSQPAEDTTANSLTTLLGLSLAY